MKLGLALAIIALVAMTPTVPASAAKDDKLPRCSGKHKRPANLYGTVLPTIPDRGLTPTSPTGAGGVPRGTPNPSRAAPASTPTTNLFPAPSAAPSPQSPTSSLGRVPAIGALGASPTASAFLPTSYASC